MNPDRIAAIGTLAIVLALIAMSAYATSGVWRECRNDGHSFAYCWYLVRAR